MKHWHSFVALFVNRLCCNEATLYYRLALKNFERCVKPGGLFVIDHRNYDHILDSGCTPSKCIYYNVSIKSLWSTDYVKCYLFSDDFFYLCELHISTINNVRRHDLFMLTVDPESTSWPRKTAKYHFL